MSILHQYRWKNPDHCLQRLHMLDSQDSLLIYGDFTAHDQHKLLNGAPFLTGRCYWLSDESATIFGVDNISYQQWLTLITEHDKTHTWK